MSDDNAHDSESRRTDSPDARFWLTNDLVSAVVIIAFVATLILSAGGRIDMHALPDEARWTLYGLVGIATIWLFGVEPARAWIGRGGD